MRVTNPKRHIVLSQVGPLRKDLIVKKIFIGIFSNGVTCRNFQVCATVVVFFSTFIAVEKDKQRNVNNVYFH